MDIETQIDQGRGRKPPFFSTWTAIDGGGGYQTLLFIGGIVRITRGFDDGVTMAATCEAQGFVPVAELSRLLAVPATVLEVGTRFEMCGWRIPVTNYHFWSMVGSEPSAPGEIILSVKEGQALRKIVEHHIDGWIPLPTEGLRPFGGAFVDGRWNPNQGLVSIASLRCKTGRRVEIDRFMVLPSSRTDSDRSLLYASGVDQLIGTRNGERTIACERWRLCRFFNGAVSTRAALAYYGSASANAAWRLDRAIRYAARLGEAVEVDKASALTTLEVSRPGPLDLELRLTGQTKDRESYDLRVPSLELLQMLEHARARGWQEGIILQSTTIGDFVLDPNTSRSLYQLLTNAP